MNNTEVSNNLLSRRALIQRTGLGAPEQLTIHASTLLRPLTACSPTRE